MTGYLTNNELFKFLNQRTKKRTRYTMAQLTDMAVKNIDAMRFPPNLFIGQWCIEVLLDNGWKQVDTGDALFYTK